MNQKLDFGGDVFQQLMKLLSIIDSFKGNWQSIELKHSKHLKELKKIATIESIGSSTRIEGATLTDAEVEKLLKSVKITKLTTREQQEVVGYYETLQVILVNYKDIALSERYIHQLHGMLLKHSAKDQSHKGQYKPLSNQVVANNPDGTQRTIFRITDPSSTSREMEELLNWTDERLTKADMHPLMITAAFVYEFLSIHPYQDGNGRLSRLLTTLLLMQQGYGFVQYVSFEHIIEERKEDYYRALMEGQKNRYKKTERIDRWILFFLDCLSTLIKRLEAKYEVYSKLTKELNERQQAVLEFAKKRKAVRMSEIEEAFKTHSRNTLKKDMAYLVNEGLLLKIGERKGTRYHYQE
ncbi:Fic family protein [Imperialibacter roseus]|uniref:Fic family protein n=1 Tax=Imperialibacter roseus TaxID=1324217 RepID=A0ABZ0IWS4_9BACT|nr:Fic family protein [Imperialibacter roseus]WOK08092.1 Fic family protein [Imperialibacter roseus]